MDEGRDLNLLLESDSSAAPRTADYACQHCECCAWVVVVDAAVSVAMVVGVNVAVIAILSVIPLVLLMLWYRRASGCDCVIIGEGVGCVALNSTTLW